MYRETDIKIAIDFLGWKWIHNAAARNYGNVLPSKVCISPDKITKTHIPVSAPNEFYSYHFVDLPFFTERFGDCEYIIDEFIRRGYNFTLHCGRTYVAEIWDAKLSLQKREDTAPLAISNLVLEYLTLNK